MVAILLILTIGVFLVVDALVRRRQPAHEPVRRFAPAFVREALQKVWMRHPTLSAADFRPHANRFYDSGHTFVELAPDGTVEVGVDRFLREAMADFRLVGVLNEGDTVERGAPIAELRSNGRTAIIRSPIEGVVTASRRPTPDEGTEPPLYCIAAANLSPDIKRMSVGPQARAWLENEVSKLRMFAEAFVPKPAMVGATSADGGEPIDPLTSHCSEQQFAEFKTAFGLE